MAVADTVGDTLAAAADIRGAADIRVPTTWPRFNTTKANITKASTSRASSIPASIIPVVRVARAANIPSPVIPAQASPVADIPAQGIRAPIIAMPATPAAGKLVPHIPALRSRSAIPSPVMPAARPRATDKPAPAWRTSAGHAINNPFAGHPGSGQGAHPGQNNFADHHNLAEHRNFADHHPAAFHHWNQNGWQGNHDHWHNNWHHGYWNGWGAYPASWGGGGYGYNNGNALGYAAVAGLGAAAGLGTAAALNGYGAGYGGNGNTYAYVNPYYSGYGGSGYNYSQPIGYSSTTLANDSTGTGYSPGRWLLEAGTGTTGQTLASNTADPTRRWPAPLGAPPTGTLAPANPAAAEPTTHQQQGLAEMDSAREAFRRGDYAQAEALANKAVALLPDDTAVHEFRALTLFAQQKYRDAAAGIYAVLSAGPGWNEETLKSLYADPKAYANQLAALETYAKDNPEASDALFLLAYHQLTAGQLDTARTELERVAQLQPKDRLAAELVQALAAPRTGPAENPRSPSSTS